MLQAGPGLSGKGAPEKHLVPTAPLVIRLRGGAGIPSLEQFSSPLPGLGGLLNLTLYNALKNYPPLEDPPVFFQTLPLFKHTCLRSTLNQYPAQVSASEELGCPRR